MIRTPHAILAAFLLSSIAVAQTTAPTIRNPFPPSSPQGAAEALSIAMSTGDGVAIRSLFDAKTDPERKMVDAMVHMSRSIAHLRTIVIKRFGEELTLTGDNESQLAAVRKVIAEKMIKRGVDAKALDPQKLENATHKTVRQVFKLKNGIDKETAKSIQKAIKDLKLKVNASIQGEALRVTGPKKDDLQSVIAHLRANPPEVPLQFNNFR